MPLDLPGFYWDESKHRYFPVSSQPKSSLQYPIESGCLQPLISRRSQRDQPWRISEQLRIVCHSHPQRERKIHVIIGSQIASTSRARRSHVPSNGRITAFGMIDVNGCYDSFLGDNVGTLYWPAPHDDATGPEWSGDYALVQTTDAPITSISVSKPLCVATTSGKFLLRDLDSDSTHIFDCRRMGAADIWCSHLRDRSLALGIRKKAAYIPDVEQMGTPSVVHLTTGSDVFAVWQQQYLVFTGARNGSIHRFDMRTDTSIGQTLFDNRLGNERASVRNLNVIRDWQLIASHTNGYLAMFDLRFPRGSHPLMCFPGHKDSVGSPETRLGITCDPSEDFLFAAGSDSRVRAWSLRTGMPLHPQPSHQEDLLIEGGGGNLLSEEFEMPVVGMQVTSDKEGSCLWAVSGTQLYRFYLGQRACRTDI